MGGALQPAAESDAVAGLAATQCCGHPSEALAAGFGVQGIRVVHPISVHVDGNHHGVRIVYSGAAWEDAPGSAGRTESTSSIAALPSRSPSA